ncbi:hypothetical protein MMC13_005444 [Lambiella insularis]|nr:hypothetical protein [Lambiella insularis]
MEPNVNSTPDVASTLASAMESFQLVYNRVSSDSQVEADKARMAMIAQARDFIAALETPLESIIWMAWAEPTRLVATRIAIDLGIFERLSESGGTSRTKDQLASVSGADPNLIGRVLKHLASMRVIEEVSADTYKATPLARALTVPKYRDAIPFCSEAAGPIFQKLPAFLAKTKYEEPLDNTAGPFQFGHDTTLRSPIWRKERPHIQKAFSNHMAGYHQGRPSWMDPGFYPVKERLIYGMRAEHDATAIVDVGGGMGHDLVELKKKQPDLLGRFILQDLPQVIEQVAQPLEGIEVTAHDFYTEQSVKGARAYYMHSVLHDWPDADCRRILQHTVAAMEKGYSKLLINENVVPDVGASWQMTSLDWFMMALAASRERTEAQWRELLLSAGLKIKGIWTKDVAAESLIEAVLVEDE